MPRLDRLPPASRTNLLNLPVAVNATTPWTPLRVPLAAARVAIVTTAGLHRRGDRPFTPGDPGYRAIPAGTPTIDIVQSHTSLGFDRVPVLRDLNVSFPIDRLRELVTRGALGGLAPQSYSFMGAQRDTSRIAEETAPECARRLREEGADVALITPT
jgi:D-proline reductase (dithiol) PrdB